MSSTSELMSWLASSRAVRSFTPEPVDADVVESVLEVARWTGSARNRQPWQFVVVRSASVRTELGALGRYAQHLSGAPVVIALGSNPLTGGADTEFDMGRACQAIVLAAAAQGLGSCPATLHPTASAERAARLVGLDGPWEVRHAVAVGHPGRPPAGRPALRAGRVPLAEISAEVPLP